MENKNTIQKNKNIKIIFMIMSVVLIMNLYHQINNKYFSNDTEISKEYYIKLIQAKEQIEIIQALKKATNKTIDESMKKLLDGINLAMEDKTVTEKEFNTITEIISQKEKK